MILFQRSKIITGLAGVCTLLAALAWLVQSRPAMAQTPVDLEIVLAVDASGSVDNNEFALQLGGIAAGLRDPAVHKAILSGPNQRIAVNLLVWAESRFPKDTTGWMLIASTEDAERAARRIETFPRTQTGGTGLGDGVAHAIRSFDSNAFDGLRQVVDVSGDGRETTPRDFTVTVPEARAMAIARGVVINGLAILTDDPDLLDYYQSHLQVGTGSFVLSATGYQDFAEAMRRKLLREIQYRPKVGRANVLRRDLHGHLSD